MTLAQAHARLAGVSRSWVHARCAAGLRGAKLVGARWEISEAALARLRKMVRGVGRPKK